MNLCHHPPLAATVYASSSCRRSRLAAAGAAIVANPYDGIERWFEPGASCSSSTAQDAAAAYAILDDPGQAEELGRRGASVLDEHTYRHRARRLLELVGLEVKAGVD